MKEFLFCEYDVNIPGYCKNSNISVKLKNNSIFLN